MKTTIADTLGQKLDIKQYKEDFNLVSNEDAIGVELELENIQYFNQGNNLPPIFGLWRAVEDGSLRNGTEFIFAEPLKAANITSALSMMQSFLDVYKRNGNPVKISERCSVHIHLDVREMSAEELNNLILIYLLVERVLFYHINPTRLKNNYCRPLTDSSFKHTVQQMIKAGKDTWNLAALVKHNCDKYSALNVLPITNYGSIEFRHHHGTKDMSEVLKWINVILALKKSSIDYGITTLLNLHKEKGDIELLKVVFKNTVLDSEEYLNTLPEISELLLKGVTDVKEVLDYDQLLELTKEKPRSKTRPENTLLHKYKKEHGLLAEQYPADEFNIGA